MLVGWLQNIYGLYVLCSKYNDYDSDYVSDYDYDYDYDNDNDNDKDNDILQRRWGGGCGRYTHSYVITSILRILTYTHTFWVYFNRIHSL